MTWMRSRSTSSCTLVRACAGTPPESPTNSSTLRPASVLLRSFRYCVSARSMSMPPEASGPVFTVIRPRRIGLDWPKLIRGKASAAPVAWMRRLRLSFMRFALLDLVEELLIGNHPAEAARDVLQPQLMQVIAVHARDAVGKHDDSVIEVEGGERRIEHTGIRIDAHQHDGF